jgi:TonB family protein
VPANPLPDKIHHVDPVWNPPQESVPIKRVALLQITIGMDGRVTNPRIVRSVAGVDQRTAAALDRAALDAVRGWRYDASAMSRPITAVVTVEFDPRR